MISAQLIAERLRHPHRRPEQRRSHHDSSGRLPIKKPGKGSVDRLHQEARAELLQDDIESVKVIPPRPIQFWPTQPPQSYLGQLEDSFQQDLFRARSCVTLEDCRFHQSVVISNRDVIDGIWDLRGREEPFLGVTNFSSARVLEFGPKSGYLTSYMETQGAQVVGFDIGWDVEPEVMSVSLQDRQPYCNEILRATGAVQNSWWYHKRVNNLSAKMAYGNPCLLPVDLGMFDVAILGDYLPYQRDPWEILSQVAQITRKRVVVTDILSSDGASVTRDNLEHVSIWAPSGRDVSTHWWAMTPGAVLDALRQLGFTRTRVTIHSQRQRVSSNLGHDSIVRYTEVPMFSVVADREWSL